MNRPTTLFLVLVFACAAFGHRQTIEYGPLGVCSSSGHCENEAHACVNGQCWCYDMDFNCTEIVAKWTCAPWTKERRKNEGLPLNVRAVCGVTCGICFEHSSQAPPSHKTTTAPVVHASSVLPEESSPTNDGSVGVHVGLGSSDAPQPECKDTVASWKCKTLKAVYACKATKYIKYPTKNCARTCGLCS